MRKLSLFIVLAITMLLTSTGIAQNLGFQMPKGKKRVRIPFQLHNNLIVIPVVVNDILPLKFVLDTGVRTTILTEKTYSDLLNLKYDKFISISGVGGKKVVDAYITNGISLELPGVRGEGHAMLVLESDYIELSNYLGTQVNGILGYELFSRFIVGINYEEHEIILTTPKHFKHRRKYKKIPMAVKDTKPYINATIQLNDSTTTNLNLMIDSGASHGLWIENSKEDPIAVPVKHIACVVGRGLGGNVRGKIARLNSFQIQNYKFNNVIATFPETTTFLDSLKRGHVKRHGTIGGDILTRFNVYFDFSSEHIYLKRNSSFSRKFEYNMSGVVIKAVGVDLDVYEISDLRENSTAAEAGVLKGDKILSINNVSTEQMTLQEVINYFSGKNHRTLDLQIEREGKKQYTKFRIERQI